MSLKEFFITFFDFAILVLNKIRLIYQNSNFYEKKISKTFQNNFEYKFQTKKTQLKKLGFKYFI